MQDNNELSSPGKSKSGFFSQNALVAGAFLILMVSAMVFVSFGIFFKPISSQFGWSSTETSGAFSLMTLVAGFMGILTGRAADRFNPRLIIIACGVLEGAAFLLLSQISSLWQLYFYYGILGGIGIAEMPPMISLVTRYYTRSRGVMTGIAMAGAGLGGTMAPLLGVYLISTYGWQTSFLIFGSLILVVIAVAGFCLCYSRRERLPADTDIPFEDRENPKVQGMSFGRVIHTLRFWVLGLILFVSGFTQQVIVVHLVPGAGELRISIAVAAALISVINIASIAGNFTFGIAVDKIGSWLSTAIALALASAGLLLLLGFKEVWIFFLFATAFGLGWGILTISRSTIIADLFGLRSHGAIMGAIILFYSIGGTLGPIIAGYIFDVSQHYQLAFILIAGLSLVSLAVSPLLRVRSRRAK